MKAKDFMYIGVVLVFFVYFLSGNRADFNNSIIKTDSTLVKKGIPSVKNNFRVINPESTSELETVNSLKYQKIITDLEEKYQEKADSNLVLKELLAYSKLRKYEEVFEDEVITAKVAVETEGYVKSIDFNYKTKPSELSYYEKTITKQGISKYSLLLGGKVITDINSSSFELNLGFQNKSLDIFEFGYNTNKQFVFGYKFNLFRKW